METSMNTRKRRLEEAMAQNAIPPNIDESLKKELETVAARQREQQQKIQEELQLQDKLKQEQQQQELQTKQKNIKRAKTDKDKRRETTEMKLKVIENWEATKLKAIERLALEVETLQELEEAIERREQELADNGISVDELSIDSVEYTYCDVNPTSNIKQLVSGSSTQQSPLAQPTRKSPAARKGVMPKLIAECMDDDSDEVVIGPNGTTVSKVALKAINWSLSGAAVTRKIIMEVFDRDTLAFHTLTGKPSPAFIDCDKPSKNQLDPLKVADIVHIVTQNLNMTAKEVRAAITTKCADENKMFRLREKKRLSLDGQNKPKASVKK